MVVALFKVVGLLLLVGRASLAKVVYTNLTGDFVLGGLFPVHRRGSGGQSCGEIQVSLDADWLLNKAPVVLEEQL